MPVGAPQHLEFWTGEDVAWVMAFPTATSLDAATLSFAVAPARGNPAALTKTVGNGVTIDDAEAGVVTVTLEDTDTEALMPGVWAWQIKQTNDGQKTVLAWGSIYARQGIA